MLERDIWEILEVNNFFISTPLGFEQTALSEFKEVWPYLLGKDSKPHALPLPEIEVLHGGLEFETDLVLALQLNYFLKTANRVLMRMTSFRVKDLPKFYQKFKSLPWLEYLHNADVEWEVAAQKSRLNNEKRLQESAEKALQEIFGAVKKNHNIETPSEKSAAGKVSIYIRVEDDNCTISLDTTGEHLHKRGWSVLKGEAPLRETISAYLLKETIGDATPSELSQVVLCDPMMGSGTILTEARSLWQGQFQRDFAFKYWKKVPKLLLSPSFIFNYNLPKSQIFKSFMGMDIEEKMLKVASANFAEVERQIHLQEKDQFVALDLKVSHQNSLEVGGVTVPEDVWMVLNPPYGERLSGETAGGLQRMASQLTTLYRPKKIGILFPEKEKLQKAPDQYEIEKVVKVNNGGLRCLYTLLTRP